MSLSAVLLAVCCWLTAASGQWLETKIVLPDSLGGATHPTCLTTDTSERYVYIGDEGYCGQGGGVYVVDAEARTRVAKVPSCFISAVCTNTRQNKVYAADYAGNQVFVISCATNQVVATVPTGAKPTALCYNSTDDKVYSANYDSDDLSVIDCSSDSIIKTIRVDTEPVSLCYNPTSNRVFCVNELHWEEGNALTVINGASDSVVAVHADTWSGPMVVNAVANRVYASNRSGHHALDGTTGIVLDTMIASGGGVMCLNSRTQKLYMLGRDLCVFDCTADTLVNWLRLRGELYPYSIACDTATGKVYASCEWRNRDDVLVVIDGVTDTIAAKIPGPHRGALLVKSKRGLVYCSDLCGPELAVFDTGNDSLLRTIMIGGSSNLMCYDSTDDLVYYVSYSLLGEAGAIDAATNQPVAHTQVGPYPKSVVWHAPTNRVYCGSSSDITIIDATADTVTKVLAVAGDALCSAPRVNKVYAFHGRNDELAVIDCRNDSVVKTIEPMDVSDMCYVSTASYDKLYCNGMDAIWIIDCRLDSMIRYSPRETHAFASDRDGKRVYCSGNDSLFVFDAKGDTPLVAIPWMDGNATVLLYVPETEKVYCACVGTHGSVQVLDAVSCEFIAWIPFSMPRALGYDSVSGLVCCGQESDSAVTFIDSRTDSIVGSLACSYAGTVIPVPVHHRVYVNGNYSSIPVIRTDPPGVEEAILPSVQNKSAGPTIVSRSSPLVIQQPSVLLDAVGRKVLDLKPGLHGLAGCRPGVYFLRACTDGTIAKILLVD